MGQGLSATRPVAVVGAGYAGMAAAVELAQRGIAAEVFEASPLLGGRARAVHLHGMALDSGPHILVGAYRQTLRLMQLLGASDSELARLPLTLVFPGAVALRAPKLPRWLPRSLPLAIALLTARGLSLGDKWAAARFMRALQAGAYRLAADCSVDRLLEAQRQPKRVRRYLWEPLCLAALNTPIASASAQVFANVLRDTLGAGHGASDMLLPKLDLATLLPERGERFLIDRGGVVRRRSRVRSITRDGAGFVLAGAAGVLGSYRRVIVAVAPWHAPALLEGIAGLAPLRAQLAALRWEPIVSCYFAYAPELRLPQPLLGQAGGHLQWLFDHGAGLLAAVISGPGEHQQLGDAQLAAALQSEIATTLGKPIGPPRWSRVIREQRATFSCTPGIARPPTHTAVAGLLLAGDYVASDYPATLEAAVASGVAAAAAVSELEATARQP